MTDDDRTLDADDDMLDELRQLAVDAKASGAVAQRETDTDVTIDADDSAMEELRRFAAEARSAASADDTPPAGTSREAPLRDVVPVAQSKESETVPLGDIPDLDLPPEQLRRARPRAMPDLEPVTPPTASKAQIDEGVDSTQLRGGVPEPIAAPASIGQGSGWRPPPRMVMPTEPEKRHPTHPGPWRSVAIGLGVAMVVLVAVFALGVVGGDDAPVDEDVPTTDVVDEPADGDGADE